MPRKSIESVLQEHTAGLLSAPGVVGTGIGSYRGRPCITVFVRAKSPELMAKDSLESGWLQVRVQETGELRAL